MKTFYIWFFIFSFLVAGAAIAEPNSLPYYDYVISETSRFTSLDPLDADSTNNLPVARMIYATPLEITADNRLSSSILESFSYDRSTKTILWKVRSGMTFDDDAPITAADVAFAVARMAFTRPKFPVVKLIKGLEDWLHQNHPLISLPSGIKIDGNNVSILLSQPTEHPLFRFALELFSIIPKKCIDPGTGKISCKSIPASGYYRMTGQDDEMITFEKRAHENIQGLIAPSKIRFRYLPAEKVANAQLSSLTVVAGNEGMFSPEEMHSFQKKFSIRFTPEARFMAVVLNPNVAPFSRKECRQLFAAAFRQSYGEIAGKQSVKSSLFPKILPGYIPYQERALDTFDCDLKGMNVKWGYAKGEKNDRFVGAVEKTMKKLGMALTEPLILGNRAQLAEKFDTGALAFANASSGFWALDPAGDVQMLFTPNLHKILNKTSSDFELQKLSSDLDSRPENFKKLNQHICENALLNAYSHLRRFYFSSNPSLIADVPFAVTSPAPWQVFQIKPK